MTISVAATIGALGAALGKASSAPLTEEIRVLNQKIKILKDRKKK